MKKTILVLITILMAVAVALSLMGDREYAAERIFYSASKTSARILANPDVAPPAMVAAAERDYMKVIDKYPGTNTAKAARIALAEFQILNKKYDEALSLINGALGSKDMDKQALALTQFLKGVAYERKGEWNRALEEFGILRDKYIDTQLGLQVPLYIGKYYVSKDMPEKSEGAYKDAAQFYAKLENENKAKILGYAAESLLIQTYLELNDYENAGNTVEAIIKDYLSPMALSQNLPYVELIFVDRLKKPERAIAIYNDVIAKVKDERVKKILQGRITKLEKKD